MKRLCALLMALLLLAAVGLASAEKYTSLYIKDNAVALFDEISGDRITIKFQVSNQKDGKNVKSFTIVMWPLDSSFHDMTNGTPYRVKSNKSVKAGKTMYSDLFYINDASSLSYIRIAIVNVVYEDGTSVSFTDQEALAMDGLNMTWRHSGND